MLATYRDPTRPLLVPHEALNLNDDFLLEHHIPTKEPNFFPRIGKIIEVLSMITLAHSTLHSFINTTQLHN